MSIISNKILNTNENYRNNKFVISILAALKIM